MGMHDDYEKHNEALRYGWVTIYLMSKDLDEMTATLEYIKSIVDARTKTIDNIRSLAKMLRSLT